MAFALRKGSAANNQISGVDMVAMVRSAITEDDLQAAERLARGYRDENGATPEALEAFSWLARGALNAHRFAKAADYARQVHRLSVRRLRHVGLDSEPHLAAALGASIEVLSKTMATRGSRAGAVRFLNRELVKFGATSIRTRIRKNLNLLTMEGQPALELKTQSFPGSKPPLLAELHGCPVLLFFWAHYCAGSRAEGRTLARIRNQFSRRGLVLIGPMRRYGYFDERRQKVATPRQELQHIEGVFSRNYLGLSGMPIPISERNFDVYGVSTKPTLVLVDRKALVSCYQQGKVPYSDLATRTEDLLIT
jgi:hypothetical protein